MKCSEQHMIPYLSHILNRNRKDSDTTMNFFDYLTLLGGQALLLYGMQLMKEGLIKAAGQRVKQILGKNSIFIIVVTFTFLTFAHALARLAAK